MKLTVLSIGKTRSQELAKLEDEYAKRIRGRFLCERVYVKHPSELSDYLAKAQAEVILLDEHGPVMTSREFAQHLDTLSRNTKHVVFVVGTDIGFPDDVRALGADQLAVSEMTFPHEVVRVLLLEQLYRAQTILDGHPYHK